MSQMLAMVTHLAEGDESDQLLQVCGVVIFPLLMTVQRRITGMTDATAIAIVAVGQAAQGVPLLSCEQVTQVMPPGRAGYEFNGESEIHRWALRVHSVVFLLKSRATPIQ